MKSAAPAGVGTALGSPRSALVSGERRVQETGTKREGIPDSHEWSQSRLRRRENTIRLKVSIHCLAAGNRRQGTEDFHVHALAEKAPGAIAKQEIKSAWVHAAPAVLAGVLVESPVGIIDASVETVADGLCVGDRSGERILIVRVSPVSPAANQGRGRVFPDHQ